MCRTTNGGDEHRRVRVTNADKQARVRAALAHPVMGKWSQHRIAEVCAVDHRFVGQVLLRRHGDNPHVGVEASVNGKDGKSYPSKKPAMSRAQAADKRTEILELLRADHTQPNTVIAVRVFPVRPLQSSLVTFEW